jgi:hypothetical protein
VATTVQSKLRESVSVKDFGAKGDGVTDDTAAIVAADTYAVANGKTLVFSGVFLVSSALTFTGKSNWRFDGATGTTSSDIPTSRLVKKSTVVGDLLTFSGSGVVLDGVAIVGQAGNTGCGLVLVGNSPYVNRAFVTGMGSHGLRIGSDAGSNVNSFQIIGPRCISNTGCGIYLHDGSINANSGSIINPICNNNTSHGFYGNKAALGVTIVCPTFEANTGYGAYLDVSFGYIGSNTIIGGDIEANVAGNLFESVPLQTIKIGVSVQGKVRDSNLNGGTYSPVVTASVSNGTFVGYSASGSYSLSGGSCNFFASISWTSNATANGQPYISLPMSMYVGAPASAFFPINILGSNTGITAGYTLVGLVSQVGQRIQLYQTNGTTLSAINFPTGACSLYLTGTIPVNLPNFFYL